MKDTIEEIENEYWGIAPEDSSGLVTTVHNLRKKKISEFDIEDLRVMIGQDVALATLVPIAIERLKEDIFSEGNYYPGDLLKNVLTAKKDFWDANPELKQALVVLFEKNIDNTNEDVTDRDRLRLRETIEDFR